MSLITQCPACSTMFKVVPDQLRISDGWVRCGQCDEVFDANANLHSGPVSDALAPEFPPEPVATSSPHPDWAASLRFASDAGLHGDGGVAAPEPYLAPLPSDAAFSNQGNGSDQSHPSDEGAPHWGGAQALDQADSGLDDFLSQSPKALAHLPGVDHETPPLEAPVETPLQPLLGPAPRYTQTHAPVAEQEVSAQPSFMRKRRGPRAWQKTAVSLLLGVTGLFLLVALVVQIALQERDRWASYEPALAPALQALCQVAGCSLSPLRRIEAVVIDSVSFTKVRTDVYRLHVALKNNGHVPVAPPALELTLTDMQDQSLIRRVLQPQDLGFTARVLEAGAEFSVVVPMAVKTGNPAQRVFGYRLLAFYP